MKRSAGVGVVAGISTTLPSIDSPVVRSSLHTASHAASQVVTGRLRLVPLLPVLALLVGMLAGQWAAVPTGIGGQGPGAPRAVAAAGSGYVSEAMLPSGVSVVPVVADVHPTRGGHPPDAAGVAAAERVWRVHALLLRVLPSGGVDRPGLPLYHLFRVLLI